MEDAQGLIEAIRAGDAARVEHMLADRPALADAQSPDGVPAVLLAMYYNEPALADLLIERGAHLDVFAAAATGRVDRLRALLDESPEQINAFAPDGFQPLGLACFFGQLEAARLLLARFADVNSASRNDMKVMPLHSSTAGGHYEITEALLEHGADVNARQAGDFTPLHAAAQNGQPDMVTLLLACGADPHASNADGRTPLDIAVEQGFDEIATLLRAV